MTDQPPIVILTALELEYRAVRDHLTGLRDETPVSGTLFETGTLRGGGEVVLAVTGPGTHGTAIIAERAIRVFAPRAVLFAGIAGSLKPAVRLGDIVVATHVYAYHGAAARPAGLSSRPRVWEIDHALDQIARRVARRIAGDGPVPGDDADRPVVHFGPVASGEVLHDARVSDPLRWIRRHYDDALAIEMEAAGVAKAGHLGQAPVAVIRAISDRADGTKAATDGSGGQDLAAQQAARFALALAAEIPAGRAATEPTGGRAEPTGGRAEPTGGRAEPTGGRAAPQTHVETHGGSHGAVAGVIYGGVHNDTRPVRPNRPASEDGGW
jgi:8-oxo-dGTP diphosphatase